MKKQGKLIRPALICALLMIVSLLSGAELIRRNISWSLESGNDPIVQITNESEEDKVLTLRILIRESSYRYRSDFKIPSGENRFLRIREILSQIGQRYPEVTEEVSGLLQIEFDGRDRDIKTRVVNLSPRGGINAERDAEALQAPVITSIEPKFGNPVGGTIVTILGENFDDSSSVKFGGIPAMRNRQSREVLIATAPAHPVGLVDIEVKNGKRMAKLEKAFRYDAESPLISGIDPAIGPVKGGIRVVITGRNFQPGTVVRWDSKPVSARFQNAEQLSVVTPAGRSGTVAIEVVNPDGKNFVMPDAFTYKGLPQIISLNPQTGGRSGNYTVTVNGSNFESGSSVLFGGRYGQTTFINPNALAALVPQGESDFVDVTVTNPDGESVTLPQGFLYNEPPRVVSVKVFPNPIVRLTTTTITVEALDPEGGALEYEYRIAQGPAGGVVTGQGNQATYSSPNNLGTAVIQVFVYDEYRAKAQGQVDISVQ
jgi:hypothetical protein